LCASYAAVERSSSYVSVFLSISLSIWQVRLQEAVVAPPTGCRNVSAHMLSAVARAQEFLNGSTLAPFDKYTGGGFWRQLTMRQSFNSGEPGEPPALLIVIVTQHAPTVGEAVDESVAEAEIGRLVAALQEPQLEPRVRLSIATLRCELGFT